MDQENSTIASSRAASQNRRASTSRFRALAPSSKAMGSRKAVPAARLRERRLRRTSRDSSKTIRPGQLPVPLNGHRNQDQSDERSPGVLKTIFGRSKAGTEGLACLAEDSPYGAAQVPTQPIREIQSAITPHSRLRSSVGVI